MSTKPGPRLNAQNINPNVVAAQYAVRGELAVKSEEYRAKLAKGDKDLPFDQVISANIGNPQQLDQKPITFFRQVLSLMENPLLLEHKDVLTNQLGYKTDVIERAEWLLSKVGSVGAYSASAGVPAIKESIAKFIERRDGFPADPSKIYLSGGASSGVNTLLNVICASPKTGVLVPIPQYPLYTASLAVLNATCVPYYLDEAAGLGAQVRPPRARVLHSSPRAWSASAATRRLLELVGFAPEVEAEIYKFVSITLCAPVVGQCMVELMVRPPVAGEPSYELYDREYSRIFNGLRERAVALHKAFADMEGVECGAPQGSMYLFPTIRLPARAADAAAKEGRKADEFYCLRLLEATGICVVPGSGFGQKEGTLHFRTTFLAPGTEWVGRIVDFHKKFMDEFR
ncbi:alanine aminotransferase [Verticillium alfalfae VaMs.102]|uniref:Alanine aminotransferase n=1 Tax=Verticillium alfalfae (strain VaMs.102 / ATCC MYA-4576 / FGSC 10136) TaxID=526221 RepID=C9SSU3_VERA1|nr:alanine aminotransferase [Verticillium alfalfae VaMs.102]EEY21858.1 alanine aminotransferase [Verticillium alfalfae VaMs.102]